MEAYVSAKPGRLCVVLEDGRKFFRDATEPHTSNEAEYIAVLTAMHYGATLVRTDSGVVVRQLTGDSKVKKPKLVELVAKVNAVADSKVKFVLVSRAGNPAREALERGDLV